ncbi:hypothetical protein HRbin15_00657 [bacterium HR15]|nr:hypothetical protein HRbin15_00657 [bacterium HR15]
MATISATPACQQTKTMEEDGQMVRGSRVRPAGNLGWWQQHRRQIGLLLLLSLLLTIAVPLFRVTIGWDIVAPVRRELALLRAAMTFPLLARKDPKQGDLLPLPEPSQVVKGSFQPNNYKIVVFVGPASPCALKSVELYRIVQKAHKQLQIILVFASPKPVVQQAVGQYAGEQLVYVSDSDKHYASRLNAFYYPRLYLLDR